MSRAFLAGEQGFGHEVRLGYTASPGRDTVDGNTSRQCSASSQDLSIPASHRWAHDVQLHPFENLSSTVDYGSVCISSYEVRAAGKKNFTYLL